MDNDTAGQLGESAVTFALDSTRYLKANIIGGKYLNIVGDCWH